jgi:hypothetical protein
MGKKLLVPVLASDRFFDAVVAAGDLLAHEGGTITFLFTKTRPPPFLEEKEDTGFDTELELSAGIQGNDEDTEGWQQQMIEGLRDATDLLLERGVADDQVTYVFADDDISAAEAIAGEAAAGAYDMVVLSKGVFVSIPDDAETPGGSPPEDIAAAVQQLSDDGVKLLVT